MTSGARSRVRHVKTAERGVGVVAALTLGLGVLACACKPTGRSAGVFGAPTDDATARATRLVAQLSLDEKVAQLETAAPAIRRLGIPAYDWWNESLHGVARNGIATVFPQVIGLAATFDEDLLRRVGQAVAEEARAKFDAIDGAHAGTARYQGLTFFAPNINIFRDPRWGRGQETFGEDPWLTARLATAYVRGLQGDDPAHLRVAAVAKHFAVHSGPELDRHHFDARVSAHDLADTYLPQFEALVREGKVAGVMAAYNRVNGAACVGHPDLLGRVLRRTWGFSGFVVGDCGAVEDVFRGHQLTSDANGAVALSLRGGTDLDCGSSYRRLLGVVHKGDVAEAEIDRALIRLFAVRFRLGLFDETGKRAAVDVRAVVTGHRALAREAAQKSMVLLQNDGVLPLAGQGQGARAVRRIAVIGPTADDLDVLVGNYHGTPVRPVTLRAGLMAAAKQRNVDFEFVAGVPLSGQAGANLAQAEDAARRADVVIACLGLSPRWEGEEGESESANPAGDRRDLALPGMQPLLLRRLLAIGKPVLVVLTGGSALTLPEGAHPNALLMAWYPGEEGGNALADIVFGDVSPAGRLPVTFYRSVADLPPFADYSMSNRTYRYFRGPVSFGFGAGMSYDGLKERDAKVDVVAEPSHSLRASLTLDNPTARSLSRVVAVFAAIAQPKPGDPVRRLVGFQRAEVPAGQSRTVTLDLPHSAFQRVDAQGERQPVLGPWRIQVGDTQVPIEVTLPDP